MKVICQVFRSPKEEGMYLYVQKDEGLSRVPEDLLKLFGKPQPAMVLLLTPEKKLARVSVEKVVESITTQGFYLQLPPRTEQDTEMTQIRALTLSFPVKSISGFNICPYKFFGAQKR